MSDEKNARVKILKDAIKVATEFIEEAEFDDFDKEGFDFCMDSTIRELEDAVKEADEIKNKRKPIFKWFTEFWDETKRVWNDPNFIKRKGGVNNFPPPSARPSSVKGQMPNDE